VRRRTFLLGAALLGLARPSRARGGTDGPVRVAIRPPSPQPGDIVLLEVTGAPPESRAEWAGHGVPLFATERGAAALVGIDLEVRAGPVGWRITRPDAAKHDGALVAGTVTVRPRTFPVQRLTLPRGMVDLDAPTLARVDVERAELKAALAAGAAERLWRGPFRIPVEGGQPTGGFGLRRLINGQPRSPHTGYDWAAPAGTPVLAVNAGRAALVAEHFFAGRNVVLDHGLGLFTFYFHLTEARLATGEAVSAGQVIGTVGATGRVTGPHLHFAVQLGGARVDPEALLHLAPPEERAP